MHNVITFAVLLSLGGCFSSDKETPFRYYIAEESCYLDRPQDVHGPVWKDHLVRQDQEDFGGDTVYYSDERGLCLSLYPSIDLDVMTSRDEPQLYPCEQANWDLCCEGPHPHLACSKAIELEWFGE